jgi:peptidoglycan/xylan/chitin deacetylase (PgdA/CDA1 family)
VLLALKIDVHSLRGMRDGVPKLVDVLQRHGASATFYLTLGRDRPQLLPTNDIARRTADLMRQVRDQGFETGVLAYEGLEWQRRIVDARAEWVEAQMRRAIGRYEDVFGERPRTHGATGWRTNVHALRLTQRLGFDYASDGRGNSPHLPVWNAELIRCPQFPTTLPTLDELVRSGVATDDNVAAHLLRSTAENAYDHVFALSAEREGGKLAAVFEQLVVGWRAQGYRLVRLRDMFEAVEPLALPRCEVGWGEVPGRPYRLLMQYANFLGDDDADDASQ